MYIFIFIKCLMVLLASTSATDWEATGINDLNESLKVKDKKGVAKNIILFLGDGMGISTISTARVYKGQKAGRTGEEEVLEFEKFPNSALIKVYGSDRQVPDSAQTATAYLCGVKTKWTMIGINDKADIGDCASSAGNEAKSILYYSRLAGKSTGIVTTTRMTHATPACAFAHSASRKWEADSNIPQGHKTCKDIAYQLIHNNSDIQVLLGGGRRNFLPENVPDVETGNLNVNKRTDNENLIQTWESKQQSLSRKYKYVWKKDDFDAIDPLQTDYVLGLFNDNHMQYEVERNTSASGEPSLAEMTDKAIRILRRNNKGYFLLVEGGRIDHAHHDSKAKKALEETIAFEAAIKKAVQMTSEDDTLLIVTADHSHPFSLSGYTKRGNDVLGLVDALSDEEPLDNLPYTALLYANGPGYHATRKNLTYVDTRGNDYIQGSAVPLAYETHSGEDVGIFARGPWSHVFRGVKEQHFIMYAMQYASCVGRFKDCKRDNVSSAASHQKKTLQWISIILNVIMVFMKFY